MLTLGEARPLGPPGVNQAVTAVTIYRFTICRPRDLCTVPYGVLAPGQTMVAA
jgi:hypothetical protein